ncbi:MAG: histidine phosphatase family protein [Candidatus Latescibacteria bacterium]|jgi:broad specificity phosphatase PhoE|nr:histidine phosphatase family protein [Candidatus Latescibacterota bacterium]
MNDKRSHRKFIWVYPIVAVVCIICIFCLYWGCWQPVTTVLIVRHAEKSSVGGADPELNPAGQQRAQTLAHVAGGADIAAIYATQFIRTQKTVEPLANYLGLSVIQYTAKDVAGLVDDIKSNHSGEIVVVAAHSNTVPQIVQELGGDPIDPISESDYDNLFIVSLFRYRGPKVLHLKFGAPT